MHGRKQSQRQRGGCTTSAGADSNTYGPVLGATSATHIQEAEHIDDQVAANQWDAWIATAQIRGGKLLHRWTKAPQNNSGHTMSVGQQGPLSLEEVLDTAERLCEL